MASRFKPYRKDYCQSQLFATNVFDLLPEDHECFLYQELFEQLDTSEVRPGTATGASARTRPVRSFRS